jgi:hypothetical protein
MPLNKIFDDKKFFNFLTNLILYCRAKNIMLLDLLHNMLIVDVFLDISKKNPLYSAHWCVGILRVLNYLLDATGKRN